MKEDNHLVERSEPCSCCNECLRVVDGEWVFNRVQWEYCNRKFSLPPHALEPSKRIRHKQETLAEGKDFTRWRLWKCCMGKSRFTDALTVIESLKKEGFKAKIWAPLPEHKNSGHVHVVVLATFHDFCSLEGISLPIDRRIVCRRNVYVSRKIGTAKLENLLEGLRDVRGFAFVGENHA